MNPDSNNSRASEVWRRFTGLFGGDAIIRKFGKEIPPEWTSVISKIKDHELDRGMRRLVHSGRDGVPSLPAFVKLCRTIQDDGIEEGPRALALPNPDKWEGDKWDIAANNRLLSYIMRHIVEKTRFFGAPGSPEMKAKTDILVAAKKRWAALMRDWDVDRETGEVLEPPMEDQNISWKGAMESAEAEYPAQTKQEKAA